MTRQCPNVKNQLRYQIKRQHNAASNHAVQSINKTINPFLQHMEQKNINTMPQNMLPSQLSSDTDILSMIR